jgi:transcriptional regulator with XRE-family HTH domain
MADPDWFAGRLKELRERKGWTQQQLADASEIPLGVVRNMEQGRSEPVWSKILKLCEALDTTPDSFTVKPEATSDSTPIGRTGRPPKIRRAVGSENAKLAADNQATDPAPSRPKRETTRVKPTGKPRRGRKPASEE